MTAASRRHVLPRVVAAALIGLALLGAVACGDDDTATATAEARATVGASSTTGAQRIVTIGVVQSLTGAGAVYGKTVVEGVELAAKQINAANPSSGVRFEYTVVDDGSSVDGAKAAFAGLVARRVDAIIGPTLSQVAPEAHRLAQEAGIPVLSATTTAAGITDVGNFVFRVALPESVVVPAALARVARDTSVKQAVLVVDGNDAFSRSSAAAMRTGLTAQGGAVVAEIDVSKANVADELARLQGQQVDVFLVTPLVETSVPVLKAIRDGGFRQPIVGGNSFNTLDIARLAGPAVEGAYVGAAWNADEQGATSRAFVQAYKAAYGAAPQLFAAQGYSSVYLLLDAAKRASAPTPAALRDALAATRDLDTPLGRLSMSDKREATHPPVTQQYRNGQLVPLP
ncbi:MAG: ABC transporter substrate-binding protein [Dehalococcoidia bacterium]|nr:ABC transporter substrate-binding protein [Dehalococcoidia bacterium]